MNKLFRSIRKLWLFATCDHRNRCVNIAFPDSTELTFCQTCGRLMHCMDDNDRTHNLHKKFPLLDYTKAERTKLLESNSC